MPKVCPRCGCDQFEVKQKAHRLISIDSEGKILKASNEWTEEEQSSTFKCEDCRKSFDSFDKLVTEQYFHEVIAAGV